MTHLRPLFPTVAGHVSGGQANLPWWADALLGLVSLVILLTLVWIVVEIVRLIMARSKDEPPPVGTPSAES
jgi:hypothetical protein